MRQCWPAMSLTLIFLAFNVAALGQQPAPAINPARPQAHIAMPGLISLSDQTKPLCIPDVPVVDEDGNKLAFYSDLVKGKTVVIDFIFTTCTTICPLLTSNLKHVQKELKNSNELNDGKVALISISIDPATDTPQKLKTFASHFHPDHGWTFITGNKSDIDELLRALGAAVSDKNEHASMVLVGDEPSGHWIRVYGVSPASEVMKAIHDLQAPAPSGSIAIN